MTHWGASGQSSFGPPSPQVDRGEGAKTGSLPVGKSVATACGFACPSLAPRGPLRDQRLIFAAKQTLCLETRSFLLLKGIRSLRLIQSTRTPPSTF
ncbi:Hypothetical predicted protein [Podarcis lilfordi]|uniref:Uncharacterized protein n=1 Tax=Podarcis lilfordi TaxID=74358 RepID=A0AA35KUC4_9SAUR|nr:Hypothetical predicted protein [Podarcis lilfordi]